MPVQIEEMEMPKNCLGCRLGDYLSCGLKENAIIYGFANEKRHPNCPLKEVKGGSH